MADITNSAACDTAVSQVDNGSTQAVCIDALRVYDSCGDKDCLADMRVFFTDQAQTVIDSAVSVRIREADVVAVLTDLEPVPFHKGFYSVDMTFFFDINLDVFTSPGCSPVQVNGLSIYNKKVILYGSEGNVKIFSSDMLLDDMDIQNCPTRNLPKATVQVAQPIALSAKLRETCPTINPPCRIPDSICRRFGGEFIASAAKSVFVTIGVFSIVQIERNVQILVPSYDFCIPEKECTNSSDNPCEVFSRLDFPTDEFFPPNVCDLQNDCGCNPGCCCKRHSDS